MWNSNSTSLDLAKGKEFLEILKYVQHVDKDKITASEISEQILLHLLADDRRACHDSNSTENVGNSESNLDILKSFLKDEIIQVFVCSNPLPIPIGSSERVTFHAFVVFVTRNTENEKIMYWSLEKNGKCIVLQQSTNGDDVISKIYDAEQKKSVKRHGEVKGKKSAKGNFTTLKYLLRVIWENNQISDPYNLLYSNCQNFASFIFEKSNGQREKWTTDLGAAVDLLRGKKKKPAIEVNAVMYQSIVKDDKFDYYKAMMDGRRKDFEELTNDLTIESLNSVDTRGYTLLEWATVFSSSDWPIDEELKKIGAEIPLDEKLFRRNVFFIALQYLPPNQNSKFLSFDEIDIHDVNGTGETALHLALYGEKWKIAEDILSSFENRDVNSTNSWGDTPLHLAAKFNCEIHLFKKILNRTNKENVNKTDGNGSTALHYAIDTESEIKIKELLNRTDVDVNIQNMEDYYTALHLASKWPTIPADLFKIILEKSTDINAHDIHISTALIYAIMTKSENAVKELLKHTDINFTNNQNVLALHYASSYWKDIPMELFKIILEKITDINTKDGNGNTALHVAVYFQESDTKVKELLKHKDVDVDIKNNRNETALHLASSSWKDFPVDIFKLILEKSSNINAQDKDRKNTALHLAIGCEIEIATKKLLEHKDVNVNVANNQNVLPLHLASWWTDIPMDLFQIILNNTNDINAQDEGGWTALHCAIRKKSGTKLKELLEDFRVDVNVKDKDHETALHLASSLWKDIPVDLFKIILERSTSVTINAQDIHGWTALHYAIDKKSETATKELLAHTDVNVNINGKFNYTPLHLASRWTGIPMDLFKIILERSDDINAQDENKRTSLHLAILQESKNHIEELLKNKDVNVNVKDNGNQNSLHLASCWKEIPMDLFKIIIKSSTDVNAQDKDGNTALHIAFRSNSQNAITALREDDRVDVTVKNKENRSASDYFYMEQNLPTLLQSTSISNSP